MRSTPPPCANRVRDEAGIAMIIVITVVMLLTLIPLAIFTQAVQQLPLARHDQDHESALHAAEAGVDDYLNRLNQNSNYWTYSATNPDPDGNGAFTSFVPVRRPERQRARRSATRPTRRRRAVNGIDLPHVDRQVAQRHAHGEGRHPAPGLPRLPVHDRLRDRRSRAVGRPVVVRVPRVAVEPEHQQLRAEHVVVQHRVLDRPRDAERAGAHERRAVRVRRARTSTATPTRTTTRRRARASRAARSFVGPEPHAEPARLHERAGLQPQQRSRRAARTCRSRPRTPRSARRPTARVGGLGLPLHRARRRSRCTTPGTPGRWTSRARSTRSTNPGCGPGTNLNLPAERRGLRADRADRARPTRTTRRAPAPRATATPR